MKELLKLVRWQNLLIVVLTMILMRYAIIEPLISKVGVILLKGSGEEGPMALQFSWYNFLILIAATVCITAGGYIINDYFDIRTDLINRGKVIVGTKIPRRQAILWHSILNIAGVAAGFYISWRAGYFWLGTIFMLVSGLLYFYSASYKRQFLVGNLIVSVLTSMVPFMVVLFEWSALYRYYSVYAIELPDLGFLFYWVGGFSLFAFLTTLIREIIKDTEDFEGDTAYGRNTIPVIIGITASKIVAISLIIITIVSLFLVWHFFVNDKITVVYISAAIVAPLIYVIYMLAVSTDKALLHRAATIMKIVMLAGILYSLLVKAIVTWNLVC